jgi:Putative carbohydrate metabolism domain
MKPIHYLFLSVAATVVTFGCVKEDHFGRSNLKKVVYYTLAGQVGNTQIVQDSLLIRISVAAQSDLTTLYADSIALSSYATATPGVGEILDFSQPVDLTVTAEDGSTTVYQVLVSRQSANPQLENASFDAWYVPEGKNYQEPGSDASTIWSTGNAGVVTLGSANVTPINITGNDNAAQLVTRDLGALGGLVGQRMASGTIFTGDFELNISDPLSSAKFGVSFVDKPKGFSIDYTYVPGTPYKNGTGQVLTKSDSCDIYLLLENREDPANIKRIATAWFRSGETVPDFTPITLDLIYGPLPAGTPAHMRPANNLYGTTGDKVTHLSFVCASSAYGALFEGGVDTKLVVNNLKLNY